MTAKILIYAYCVGVFSSDRMQRRLVEDVALRMLAAGNQPDFRILSDFRKLHLEALEELFQQVLRITVATGTMSLSGTNDGPQTCQLPIGCKQRIRVDRCPDRRTNQSVLGGARGTGAVGQQLGGGNGNWKEVRKPLQQMRQ